MSTRGFVALVLALSACDDGWHEGEPVDRAFTSWSLIPSADEQRFAMTLEPRLIHRDEQGVLTLGYRSALAGPPIAVDADGAELATLDRGTIDVELGDTRAWLMHADLTDWDHMYPVASPPREPLVRAAIFDRTTFATSAFVTLSPPIDIPIAVGDELFDVPSSGSSDIAREIYIRLRHDDGSATALHTGRGFASRWCSRGTGLILAYQLESPASDLRVVAARRATAGGWETIEATFPGVRFDPTGIACNTTDTHAAVVTSTGTFVLDVAGARIAVSAYGVTGPMVVRGDGNALLGVRALDRVLVWVDTNGARPTTHVSAKQPAAPLVAGDLAMFELEKSLQVIDLADGHSGPTIESLEAEQWSSMYPYAALAWPAGGGFIVQLERSPTYAHELGRLLVVDGAGVTDLPLPHSIIDPRMLLPGSSRLYMRTQATADADPTLFGIDLPTKTLVSEHVLPLCDEQAVLELRGCR